jgi:hypothetical protein
MPVRLLFQPCPPLLGLLTARAHPRARVAASCAGRARTAVRSSCVQARQLAPKMRTAMDWPVSKQQSSPFTPTGLRGGGPGYYAGGPTLSPSQRLPSGGALLSPDSQSARANAGAAPVTPRKKVSLPTTAHSWWCAPRLGASLSRRETEGDSPCDRITSVAPLDSERLVSASYDKTVRVWGASLSAAAARAPRSSATDRARFSYHAPRHPSPRSSQPRAPRRAPMPRA